MIVDLQVQTMTIRTNEWYRIKSTHQYCVVQKIPSTTDPRVSIATANPSTRGFELALTWYTPTDEALENWTKRVIILAIGKALALFREPTKKDRAIIARLKSLAHSIPVSAASRDGEFTLPM
jgi:hypothetical protein